MRTPHWGAKDTENEAAHLASQAATTFYHLDTIGGSPYLLCEIAEARLSHDSGLTC
jgi:hypothetical protein